MSRCIRAAFTALSILISSTSSLLANQTTTNFDEAKLESISNSKQWLHLLHYHSVGFDYSDESQIDDDDFFLAENGKYDPLSELKASISAFAASNPEAQQFRCAYPARFSYLKKSFPSMLDKQYTCPEYEKWLEEVSPKDLTLIFPAAYLNSPSSMFGHTLMRIDSSKHTNPLLAYSINYAANADPDDNELVFSYKGLTGGYPGIFSVLPYYQKVKEYSYLESRDVWEYGLDIRPDELKQFMRHVWEIKDAHFDYYFFTENCSYHLLTLLDAASQRFDFSKAFTTDVIPADTVRVLHEAGIIESAAFRPSMQTTMDHQLGQTSDKQHSLAQSLVKPESNINDLLSTQDTTNQEKAQSIELAVAYARYLAKKDKDNSKHYNKRSIALLSSRSTYSGGDAFSETPTPKTRDDEGHRSHRWQIAYGHNINGNYAGLALRMAYHDFLDPISGYLKGAQLEILNLKAKAYASHSSLEIDEFRAIDIASLSPRNDFISPISWFVSTGLQRNLGQRDELMPYLNAGPGMTYAASSTSTLNWQTSFLLNTRLNLDDDINKGYAFESGPRILLLSQNSDWSTSLEWQRFYSLAGNAFKNNRVSAGLGLPIGSKYNLRAEVHYEEASTHQETQVYDTSAEISLSIYF